MLLFINCGMNATIIEYLFQYISCCYLSRTSIILIVSFYRVSIHLMLLFIEKFSLNSGLGQFQYISCCYLSGDKVKIVTEEVRFQYISCCYLSSALSYMHHVCECFNTSHVVIYHKALSCPHCGYPSFNTSHVVIYHISKSGKETSGKVSIHLMLLFIICKP